MTERYDSRGEIIIYDGFIGKTVSTLSIPSLNVTHSGNYSLQANNDYTMERINITLDVTGIKIIF